MVPVVTAILHWESNQDRLEATFVGPMRMIRDTLQEADDPSLEVIRLQKHFRFPVELLYFNSDGGAPDWLERSLNEDEMFFDLDENGKHVSYLRFDDDRVLRYGPLPKLEWFGSEGQIMALVLLLIGGFLLVRLLVRPLSRQSKVLAGAAKQVSDGHFGSRISINSVPHAPEVVHAFNQMTGRIEQLMISHRQLLQDVSHELRTPLARWRFGLQILHDTESEPEERARVAAKLDAAIQQLDDLVEEILQYTRLADKDHRKVDEDPVDLTEIVGHVVQRFELAAEQGKAIEINTPDYPLPPLVGNSRELARALDNLLANALRFADSRIQIELSLNKESLSIVVADDGPGIPDDMRDRVLQPFVQLERSSNHNGLGLAIVERITLAHGGCMEVDSSKALGGAAIRINLPVT